MAAANGTVRGKSAFWMIYGFDLDSNGQITGATTPVEAEYDFVKDHKPTYAASADATATAYIQARTAQGVTVEVPEVTTVIDGTTGNVKTSGSGNSDKIAVTLYDTTPETVAMIAAARGVPCLVCIPHGYNPGSPTDKFYYLLGVLSSEVTITGAAETFAELALEFTGKSYTADTGGDTALTWSPNAVTPIGGSAVTPTPLVAGDLTTLKSGQIVQK